jgi:hypothetical protein
MIQTNKSPTKPAWQVTIALTSTTTASQPTLTPEHKLTNLQALDYSQADHISSQKSWG